MHVCLGGVKGRVKGVSRAHWRWSGSDAGGCVSGASHQGAAVQVGARGCSVRWQHCLHLPHALLHPLPPPHPHTQTSQLHPPPAPRPLPFPPTPAARPLILLRPIRRHRSLRCRVRVRVCGAHLHSVRCRGAEVAGAAVGYSGVAGHQGAAAVTEAAAGRYTGEREVMLGRHRGWKWEGEQDWGSRGGAGGIREPLLSLRRQLADILVRGKRRGLLGGAGDGG